MGLIRWIKKEIDGANFQRRESAPPRPVRNFDPNRSRDEAYVKAFTKFNEWRTNERNRRVSEVIPTSIASDHAEPSRSACSRQPMELNTDETIFRNGEFMENDDLLNDSNNHMNTIGDDNNYLYDTIDNVKINSIPRHSLPANMSKSSFINKSLRIKKRKSSRSDKPVIHEDEVKQFENSHCYGNLVDNPQSAAICNSPPTKFYKQNSNPYPSNGVESITPNPRSAQHPLKLQYDNEFIPRSCPAKPKRLMLKPNENKSRDLTKEITEAHFNGSYKNFEIHPQMNNDGSKSPTNLNRSGMRGSVRVNQRKSSRASQNSEVKSDYLNGSKRNSAQYQTIINKHGDVVEYAVPYCDQNLAAPTARPLDVILSADELEDEVFVTDQNECERLINENFRFLTDTNGPEASGETPDVSMSQIDANISRRSLYARKPLKPYGNVIVTDLDKSVDSSKTMDDNCKSQEGLDDLHSLSKWSDNLVRSIHPHTKSQNDLLDFLDLAKSTVSICQLNEIKPKISVLRNTFSSPVEIMSGIFRKSTVALRNYSFNVDCEKNDACLIAEQAIRRDFDILKQIRHRAIVTLMAVSCNMEFKDITLILEPADYTLHYYLHQMDEKLSIFDSISIVQQIANAALYLQECGYIHSNISSHCILMSKCPKHVKLTSFELTTNVSPDVQNAIQSKFNRSSKIIHYDTDSLRNIPTYTLLMRNSDKYLKEHYRELSKGQQPAALNTPGVGRTFSSLCVQELDPQFLPYCVEYRQQLSVFNYQPPELLTTRERFVFPTRNSDVYSLTLLLWELLNQCVPFVIFSENELEHLYAVDKAVLPTFEEERCQYFKQIFKYGFECDPINRSMTVHHLISLLEDVKFDIRTEKEQHTDNSYGHSEAKRNLLYDYPKLNQRISTENIYENTDEIFSTHVEPQKQSNGLVKDHVSSVKLNEQSPNVENKTESPLNNVTNSTLYRSVLDFNKLLSPRRAANANIYERTSTMKKRKKATSENKSKKNITELFNRTLEDDTRRNYDDISNKLNDNIIVNSQNDLLVSDMDEGNGLIGPVTVREVELPSKRMIKDQQTKFLKDILNDDGAKRKNPIVDNLAHNKDPNENGAEREKHNRSSYKFNIDEYSIPETVIARNNKIRRNTWLSSDQSDDLNSPTDPPTVVSAELKCDNKMDKEAQHVPNESAQSNKKLNVSIKIIHKHLSPNENLKSKPIELDITGVDNPEPMSEEESPSVMSRIKFFRSLEQPDVSPTPNNKSIFGRQSETPKMEQNQNVSKGPVKNDTVSPTTNNKQLLRDIVDISAEINSLTANRLDNIVKMRHNLKPIEKPNNITVGYNQPFIDELNNSLKSKLVEKNVWSKDNDLFVPNKNIAYLASKAITDDSDDYNDVTVEANERRNSVLETVQQFEKALTSPKNTNLDLYFKKIDNKLFNEKVNNNVIEITIDAKSNMDNKSDDCQENDHSDELKKNEVENMHDEILNSNDLKDVSVAKMDDEKQESVLSVVCLPEYENDSAATPFAITTDAAAAVVTSTSAPSTPVSTKSNQTLIKRTVYHESIVSGTDIEIAELEKFLDAKSTQTATTIKSSSTTKLTTRVTLNLRRFKRRLSDVGLFPDAKHAYDQYHEKQSSQIVSGRHSICGNELYESTENYRNNCKDIVTTTCGRSLQEIFNSQKVLKHCEQTLKSDISALMSNNEYSFMQNSVNSEGSPFRARANGNMDVQSIEDLYIDDDFCQGMNLAANMRLLTNSEEMFDNIDFDIISTHFFEETKASVTTNNVADLQLMDSIGGDNDENEDKTNTNDTDINLDDCNDTKNAILENNTISSFQP